MAIIKICVLFGIFGLTVYLGNAKANKYIQRVKELVAIKCALNILENKIKFTQTPLNDIFKQISGNISENNIVKIFENLASKQNVNLHKSWKHTITVSETNLCEEDKKILIDMGNILGSTDIEGQVSNIKITNAFIDRQIEKAEAEKNKNVKMFRTLGVISGLTIVIILI